MVEHQKEVDREMMSALSPTFCSNSTNSTNEADHHPHDGLGGSSEEVITGTKPAYSQVVGDRTAKAPTYVVCFSLNQLERKWPRLFHLSFRVLAPLFGLIGVTFLCGYFLARLESGSEMSSNNAVIANSFNFTMFFSSVAHGNFVPDPCIADWDVNNPVVNQTGLQNFLEECSVALVKTTGTPDQDDVTFDWILCGDDPTTESNQYEYILSEWTDQYFSIVAELSINGTTFQDAHDEALSSASGTDDCRIHSAAGALFWFTVMTTMGYGNTSPGTAGGRALVYTLGLLSILLFWGIISSASSICIAIGDDFFLRIKAKWLTKGFWASMFWLAMLCLWLLVLAATYKTYEKDAGGSVVSLADSFWFAYMSTTTVGLGDIYIRPETFRASDMFTLPFLFLLGFVLITNFLYKVTEWLSDKIPHPGQSLEALLEESRNPAVDRVAQKLEHESSSRTAKQNSLC